MKQVVCGFARVAALAFLIVWGGFSAADGFEMNPSSSKGLPLRSLLLVDDFPNEGLPDANIWNELKSYGTLTQRLGILVLTDGEHKRINTKHSFTPEARPIVARALVRFGGNYQKFGFNVNYSYDDKGVALPGFYFDTLEADCGGEPNFVHALVWVYETLEQKTKLLDVKVPVRWGEFHEFAVVWKADEVAFWIDGRKVAQVAYAFAKPLPVGIWNDRGAPLLADRIEVGEGW